MYNATLAFNDEYVAVIAFLEASRTVLLLALLVYFFITTFFNS